MKDLKIGDPVTVFATTEVDYDSELNRQPMSTVRYPFKAVVIGKRTKMLGKLHRGGGFEEWEPPYLAVKGAVKLWEVRTGLENKPLLVDDKDLEPCEPFELPRLAGRPRWKMMD